VCPHQGHVDLAIVEVLDRLDAGLPAGLSRGVDDASALGCDKGASFLAIPCDRGANERSDRRNRCSWRDLGTPALAALIPWVRTERQ